MDQQERAELFDLVEAIGEVVPASQRVDYNEMRRECFMVHRPSSIYANFELEVTPNAFKAIASIVRRQFRDLPRDGLTSTRFNCLDLLSRDLDRVFMGLNWYDKGYRNGFAFDAEEFLIQGAFLRRHDLVDHVRDLVRDVGASRFQSVATAKIAIKGAIDDFLISNSVTGNDGIASLWRCAKKQGKCPGGEIVWDGPLPLDLAIEGWRNGTRVW